MAQSLLISLENDPNPLDVQAIRDGLYAFNRQTAPHDFYQPLTVFLRKPDQTLLGGLLGETYWDWLHVDIFWLDETVRRQGLGQKLLRLAENEAWRRGCRHAHLDTLDWQALPFYQKYGYAVFGVLDDHPAGHKRYFLSKTLTPLDTPL